MYHAPSTMTVNVGGRSESCLSRAQFHMYMWALSRADQIIRVLTSSMAKSIQNTFRILADSWKVVELWNCKSWFEEVGHYRQAIGGYILPWPLLISSFSWIPWLEQSLSQASSIMGSISPLVQSNRSNWPWNEVSKSMNQYKSSI